MRLEAFFLLCVAQRLGEPGGKIGFKNHHAKSYYYKLFRLPLLFNEAIKGVICLIE